MKTLLYLLIILMTSCGYVKKLEKNMDSNYKAKSGKAAAEKAEKDTTRTLTPKF